jgi:hypothetical protein
LYPNPAQKEIFISSTEPVVRNIEVFNILGEPVLLITGETNMKYLSIDISSLPVGNYFVKAGDKKFRFVKAE